MNKNNSSGRNISGVMKMRKGAWTEEEDRLLRNCIHKYGEGKWHQVPHRAGLNRCRKSCRLRWLNYLRPNIKKGNFDLDEIDLIIRLHKLLGNRWSLIAGRLPGRTANDVKNYWNTHMKKHKKEVNGNSSSSSLAAPANIVDGNNKAVDWCNFCRETTTTITINGHYHDHDNDCHDHDYDYVQKKTSEKTTIIKPRPRSFYKNSPWSIMTQNMITTTSTTTTPAEYQSPCPIKRLSPPPSSSSSQKMLQLTSHHDHDEMQWLENLFNNEEEVVEINTSTAPFINPLITTTEIGEDMRVSNLWLEETCGNNVN